MTRVQLLEHEVKKLNRPSLTVFRNWFRRLPAKMTAKTSAGLSKLDSRN